MNGLEKNRQGNLVLAGDDWICSLRTEESEAATTR